MKLNNKGITLIEIIISIVLISIVLIYLFSLLVTVNDMNDESDINSTYLVNKALIIKNIEEDLSKVNEDTTLEISKCSIADLYGKYGETDYFIQESDENLEDSEKTAIRTKRTAKECIKISGMGESSAYLAIYYYKNKDKFVISYIHDNIRATRELPDYMTYNVDDNGKIINPLELYNSSNNKCSYNSETGNIDGNSSDCSNNSSNFYKIVVPIIGSDGKDYSILISYYGKVEVTTG